MKQTLYSMDNRGHLREWTITADYDNQDLIIEHGLLDGKKQVKVEHIPAGKVKRTVEEQMNLQMESRISRQLDKGYKYDILDCMNGGSRENTLALPRPMLALKYMDFVDVLPPGVRYVQRKYDGNRCLIANTANGIVAYTRNGNVLDIPHITTTISMPAGMIVDGELYCHGETLQTICSWIKRKQVDTERLRYHAYDSVAPYRFAMRYNALYRVKCPHMEIAPTLPIMETDNIFSYLRRFREEGYEGVIVRPGHNDYDEGYIPGKRSRSLLKLKEWQDAEFKVIDVKASKDGWGILTCGLPEGKTFDVSAPGTIPDKRLVLNQAFMFIGKFVTVEFAYYTEDGKPFNPVAKCWVD